MGTSDRIPIFQYSDRYRTKEQLSEYQTNISIGLATLDFQKSDSYRNDLNLSDKKREFLLLFTSFFTNFSALWWLYGEFPRKLMTCWRPYCAVAVHNVVLAPILCCWRPYCAVGVPADASTVVGYRLFYFWHPCSYGSPLCCWRCDVPIVSASVGLPPCCRRLHCFCKHLCFWRRPYCVGGPVVALIPAVACFSAIVSSHDITVILNAGLSAVADIPVVAKVLGFLLFLTNMLLLVVPLLLAFLLLSTFLLLLVSLLILVSIF